MKQKNKMGKRILLGLWTMSLLVSSSWAAGLGFIIDSDGTPTIDGVADAIYTDAIAYNISNVVTGSISSNADLSATYKALWDSHYLYILVEVADEASARDSADTWDDDGIEIYLDADHSQSTSYGPKDYLYTWGWKDKGISELAHGATSGVAFGSTEQTDGYTFEVKIPWQTLDVTASSGMQIGLDIHVNDDDDGGARDGKLTWHTLTNSSGSNPSLFGTAELYRVSSGGSMTADAPSKPISEDAQSETESIEESEEVLASKATRDETLGLLTALENGQSADRSRLNTLVQEVREDANLTDHDRFVVAARVGGLAIKETQGLDRAARFTAYETLAKELVAEFPGEAEPYESLLALANDQPDAAKGKQLAQQLLTLNSPESIKAGAQRMLDRMDMIGKPLDFSFQDSRGATLSADSYRGKIVVLYAWTGMGDNSHRWVSGLLGQAGEEVICIGLNVDPDASAAQAKISDVSLNSLQVYDPGGLSGPLAEQLNLSRLPTLYLIDRTGVVREIGSLRGFPEKLNQLLKEGGRS